MLNNNNAHKNNAKIRSTKRQNPIKRIDPRITTRGGPLIVSGEEANNVEAASNTACNKTEEEEVRFGVAQGRWNVGDMKPGCQGRGGHVFPRNPKRKVDWLKAIKWADSNDPPPTALVCHQHFLETDYKNSQVDLQTFAECGTLGKNRRLRLKRTAVPSVFLNEVPRVQQIVTEKDGELLIEITDRKEGSRVQSDNEDNCETIIVVGDCDETTREDDVLIIEEDAVSYEYPRDGLPPDPNYDYETDDDSHDDSPYSDIVAFVKIKLEEQDSANYGELFFTNSALASEGSVEEVDNMVTITEFVCHDHAFEVGLIVTIPVTNSGKEDPHVEIPCENLEPAAQDESPIFNDDGHLQNSNSDTNESNGMEIVTDEEADLNSNVPTCKTPINPKEAFVTTFKMTKKYVSVKPNELKGKSAKHLPKTKSAQPLPKTKSAQPISKTKSAHALAKTESAQPLPKITLMRKGTDGWVVNKKRVRHNQKGGNLMRRKVSKKQPGSTLDNLTRKARKAGVRKLVAESTQSREGLTDLLLLPHGRTALLQFPCIDARIPLKRVAEPNTAAKPCDANSETENSPDISLLPDERPTTPEYPCIDVSDDDSYSSIDDVAHNLQRVASSQSSESIEIAPGHCNPLSFIGEFAQSAQTGTPKISTLSIKQQILQQVAMRVGSAAKEKILKQLAKNDCAVTSLSPPGVRKSPGTPEAAAASSPSAAPASSAPPRSSNLPKPSVSVAESKTVNPVPSPNITKNLTTSLNNIIKSQPKTTVMKTKKPVQLRFSNLKTFSTKLSKKINILKKKKIVVNKSKKGNSDPFINKPVLSKANDSGEPLFVEWNQGIPENAQFLGTSGDKTFFMVEDVTIRREVPPKEPAKSPPREIRKLVEEWGDSDEDEDYQMLVIPDPKPVGLPVTDAAHPDSTSNNVSDDDDCAIIDDPPETIDLCGEDEDSPAQPQVSLDEQCPAGIIASVAEDHEVHPAADACSMVMRKVKTSSREKHSSVSGTKLLRPAGVRASIAKIIADNSNSAAKIVIPPPKKVSNVRCVPISGRGPPYIYSEDPKHAKKTITLVGNVAVIASEAYVQKPIEITVMKTVPESFPASERRIAQSDGFGWMELPPTPASSPTRSPDRITVEKIPEEPIYLSELLAETNDEITISADGVLITSPEAITSEDAPANLPAEHAAAPCLDIAAPTTAASLPVPPPLEMPILRRWDEASFESPTIEESAAVECPDTAIPADADHQPPLFESSNSSEGSYPNVVTNDESSTAGCPGSAISAGADHGPPFLGTSNPSEGSCLNMAVDSDSHFEPPNLSTSHPVESEAATLPDSGMIADADHQPKLFESSNPSEGLYPTVVTNDESSTAGCPGSAISAGADHGPPSLITSSPSEGSCLNMAVDSDSHFEPPNLSTSHPAGSEAATLPDPGMIADADHQPKLFESSNPSEGLYLTVVTNDESSTAGCPGSAISAGADHWPPSLIASSPSEGSCLNMAVDSDSHFEPPNLSTSHPVESEAATLPDPGMIADADHQPKLFESSNPSEGLYPTVVTNDESSTAGCPGSAISAGADHGPPFLGTSNPSEGSCLNMAVDSDSHFEPPNLSTSHPVESEAATLPDPGMIADADHQPKLFESSNPSEGLYPTVVTNDESSTAGCPGSAISAGADHGPPSLITSSPSEGSCLNMAVDSDSHFEPPNLSTSHPAGSEAATRPDADQQASVLGTFITNLFSSVNCSSTSTLSHNDGMGIAAEVDVQSECAPPKQISNLADLGLGKQFILLAPDNLRSMPKLPPTEPPKPIVASVNCSGNSTVSHNDGTGIAAEVDVQSECAPPKQISNLADLGLRTQFILLALDNVRSMPKLPPTEPPKPIVASYEHIAEDHCYFSPYPMPKVVTCVKNRNQKIRTLKPQSRSVLEKRANDLLLAALMRDAKERKWAVSLKRLSEEELAKYTPPPASPKRVVEQEQEESSEDDCDFSEAMEQTCYHCDEEFATLKALRKHIFLKHKYNQLICPHCFAGFLCPVKCNEHIRDAHKQISSEITYACTQCNFTTNDHCALRGHIDVAHKVQRHKTCSECIFKCTSDAAMEEHMERYHSAKRQSGDYVVSNIQDLIGEEIMPLPIGLPIASKFTVKSSVGQCDQSGPYPGGVPISNQIPNKPIGEPVSDQTPITSGTGQFGPRQSAEFNLDAVFGNTSVLPAPGSQQVPCPNCPSVFGNLAALGKHIVLIHEKYNCPICRKAVSNMAALKAHMRTHMVPKCPLCRLQFPAKDILMRHVHVAHTQQYSMTLWCQFCPFATVYEPALKLHYLVIHKMFEFPNKCPVCESTSTRNFENIKELLIHTARVHYLTHNEVTRDN